MQPVVAQLDSLLQSMWFSPDAELGAHSANYVWEERVSAARQQAYERSPGLNVRSFDEWDRWHRDQYLWTAIHREVPETFTEANREAGHSATLSSDQYLVRVEGLEHALGRTGFALDDVFAALRTLRSGSNQDKYSVVEANDALAVLCDELNGNPYGVRPRFAGFLQDIEESLAEPDWADQVRDRFGLGHYKPERGDVIPIALMRYKVRDVLKATSNKPAAVVPICVPTVLDGQFSPFFVPSPASLPYGRTLDLAGDPSCERKVAEVLHLRLDYRPDHVFMVGAITKGLDSLETVGLKELRSDHLFCVQYDSDREDFGNVPTRWAAP